MRKRSTAGQGCTAMAKRTAGGGRGASLGLGIGFGAALLLAGCASDGDEGAAAPAGASSSSTPGTSMGASAGSDQRGVDGASNEGAPAASSEGQDPSLVGNVSGADQGPVTPPESAPLPAPEPSSGCAALAPLVSGEQTLEVDGVERSYVLDVPADYDGLRPLPLVFAFHGATTSGALFRSPFYGNLLSTMADVAIVVHPDALGDPTAWDTQTDIPFFDALLAELGANLCVDEARVFATGHSSGGFFTNALGCQRGDVLRAIAPVSGGGPFTRPANRAGDSGCTGEVAVWLAHAENDQTVPFDSGVDSRDRWLAANGCSDATVPVDPSPCVEYTGCNAGLPVRWCVYQDGHNFPDFGPQGIWGFFSGL